VLSDNLNAHECFMRLAVAEARKAAAAGDIPVGAVIVRDGCVVGRGFNRTEAEGDPTMHAEMVAIREAAKTLRGWRLTGCRMYVTAEPCSMCAGACVLARLDAVYAGTHSPKSGAAGSVKNILCSDDLNHKLVYETGILKEECAAVLKDFFAALRTNGNRKHKTPSRKNESGTERLTEERLIHEDYEI
jgi:tRNA(adenine34) deaminase